MTTRKNIISLAGGGSTLAPNIVRGGKAIDLGNNFYYIKGRKHKNGGVDVGENAKTGLEVEGEEVMQVKPDEVRVFSSVPFLRGVSPAELVMNGNNPDAVFAAQEEYKDRNRLDDDGSKYKNGGNKLSNIQYIINKINNSDKDFAKRLKQNNRQYIKDWEFPNSIATHKLSVGTDENGNNYIYPEVQNINGELHDFTDPKHKHNKWDSQISAEERGDTIRINTIQDGIDFTTNYKNLNIYPKFNYGGNMIASINGNVKNGLIHTEMKCGGRKKAKYGAYDNMLGLGRADYNNKLERDRQYRELISLTPNLPDILTKVNIEDIKRKSKTIKSVIRNGKPTIDPVDIFLAEHPNIDKGIKTAADILSTWITFGSNIKAIKPIVTKLNIKPKQIETATKSINYKKPNYPATVQRQKVNNPYSATKSPKEEIIENINIPEQLKLPDSKTLYENAIRIGRRSSTMSKKASRELDKIYDKVVGNKPPRSGFEFKHQSLELPYTPSTTNIGRTYDATAEWNRYFGKYLYKNYVKKYGKKGVDKALKKEGISVYKYGGRKKADLGLSYYAKSLFGPKYDKVVDLNADGTRGERSLLYADSTKPYRSFADVLLSGDIDNYSSMGSFNNRRIEGYRNTTPYVKVPDVSTPITTSTAPVSTTSTAPVQSTLPVKDKSIPDYVSRTNLADTLKIRDNLDLTPNITKGLSIKSSPSLTGSQQQSRTSNWWNDDNLDKINLYTNIGASTADFITNAILNSQLPTYSLPTMTAPTLAALPEIKLADIKEIEAPKTVAAAKLKTRYNANPQLAKIEDETRRTIDDIDRNTADSRVALARKQRARIASQEAKNQVYGQKENIETDLINKDKLNAQAVAQSNTTAYNNYLAAKAQQAMGKAQLQMMVDKANIGNKLAVDQFNANAKLTADQFNTNNKIKEILGNNAIETTKLNNYAQGISNLLGNIGGSIDTFTRNSMSRKRDAEALRALRARYKDIPDEILKYIIRG